MYNFLLGFHSFFRYLVLLILLAAIISTFLSFFIHSIRIHNRNFFRYSFWAFLIQGISGIILYFLSPYVQFSGDALKIAEYRYWTVEHIFIMILSVILSFLAIFFFNRIKAMKKRLYLSFFLLLLSFLFVMAALIMSQRGVV